MSNHIADQALSRIDIGAPLWKTLVVLASAESDAASGLIWHAWTRIEDWPSMSPLVVAARWTNGQPWRVGSEFVQELNLGFPFRNRATAERVASVEPGVAIEWGSDSRGLRRVHLWRLENLDGGGCRITSVAVFHGSFIGVVKHIVAKRWQQMFQAQIDGLINLARENARNLDE
jgi:hypothetical protein